MRHALIAATAQSSAPELRIPLFDSGDPTLAERVDDELAAGGWRDVELCADRSGKPDATIESCSWRERERFAWIFGLGAARPVVRLILVGRLLAP